MKRTRFFAGILLLLVLIANIGRVYSKTERFNSRIEGSKIVPGASIIAQDDKFDFMINNSQANWPFKNKKVKCRVKIGINPACKTMVSPYDIKIRLMLVKDDLNGGQVLQNDLIAKIDYDPVTGDATDEWVYEFDSYYSYSVNVTEIIDFNGTTITCPENIFLEAQVETERYYQIKNYLEAGDISMNHRLIYYSDINDNNPDELEIYWNYIKGAEEYDLEWTYVNNYGEIDGLNDVSELYLNEIEYNFRFGSTRITTSKNFYRIPLIFERGYIFYRVRAVGRHMNDLSKNTYTLWYPQLSSSVSSGNWCYYNPQPDADINQQLNNTNSFPVSSQVSTAHEYNKNWQYIINFSEEGKRKESINYMDGSMRSRQMLTKNNSNGIALAGQDIYDYAGRAAIKVLPVPTNKSDITYYELFNQNAVAAQNSPDVDKMYHPGMFDISPGANNVCTLEMPEAMSSESGSANYYSPMNPDQAGINAYIPDAEGYPFSQVEYMPDNTGRVKRQSGIGPDYQLTGENTNDEDRHETWYYYETPNPVQLNRLFGTDVGFSSHYRKNTVIDANGQASINYIDMNGKTIATSLAGSSRSGFDLLRDENGNALNAQANAVTDDILNKLNAADYDTEDDNNELSTDREALVATQMFTVIEPGQYIFNYNAEIAQITGLCNEKCYTCVYDLEISLRNECGEEVALDINSNPAFPVNEVIGNEESAQTQAGVCPLPLQEEGSDITVFLSRGTYTLTKTIKLHTVSFNNYLNQYTDDLESGLCSQFQSESQFFEEYYNASDTLNCYLSSQGNGHGDQETTTCYLNYLMLLKDVQPDGQYAKYDIIPEDLVNNIPETYNADAYTFSVLKDGNDFCNSTTGTATWRSLSIRYKEKYNDNSLIPVVWHGGTSYYPEIDPLKIPDNTNFGLAKYRTLNDEYDGIVTHVNPEMLTSSALSSMNGMYNSMISVEFDPVTNTYSPEIDVTMINSTNFNNNLFATNTGSISGTINVSYIITMVAPQLLKEMRDFVINWKSTWNEALVTFHPEYPYYESCRDYGDKLSYTTNLVTGFSITSNMYDRMLLMINDYATASNFQVDVNGTPSPSPGIDFMNPTAKEIFINDPFFNLENITSDQYEDFAGSGGFYAAFYTQMNSELTTSYLATGLNMYELACMNTKCPSYFDDLANLPTDCKTISQTDPTSVKNEIWQRFRGYYFSAKQHYQSLREQAYATDNGAYNGCIGADASLSYNPYTIYGNSYGPTSNCLICGFTPDYHLFSQYSRRFNTVTDYINTGGLDPYDPANADAINEMLGAQSGYDYYMSTGQCPMAKQVLDFVNAMLHDSHFLQSGYQLFFDPANGHVMPQFTADIYHALNSSGNFVAYEWNSTVNGNNLIITIQPAGGSPQCTIELTNGSALTFNDIITFSNISFTSESQGVYNFNINAMINSQVISLSGSTCLPVGNCEAGFTTTYSSYCEPNETASDFQSLFSLLVNNNQFSNTNGVSLQSLPYKFVFQNNILALLYSAAWNWKYIGNAAGIYTYKITPTGTVNREIIIEFDFGSAGIDPLTISNFSNIKPVYQQSGDFVIMVDYNNTSAEVSGNISLNISGSGLNSVILGTCGNLVYQICDNDYNYLRDDLYMFLQEIIDPFNTESPVATSGYFDELDLTYVPEFTDLMEQQLVFGDDYNWELISSDNTSITGHIVSVQHPNTDCDISIGITQQQPGLTPMTINDVKQFADLVVDESNSTGGHFYSFTMTGYNNDASQSVLLHGSTSCFPIENCNYCADGVSINDISVIQDGDFEAYNNTSEFVAAGISGFNLSLAVNEIMCDQPEHFASINLLPYADTQGEKGFICFAIPAPYPNNQVQLIAGETYKLTFDASIFAEFASEFSPECEFDMSNYGVAFITDQNAPTSITNYTPDYSFSFNASNQCSSYSFEFVASGNETFLIIGRFNPNPITTNLAYNINDENSDPHSCDKNLTMFRLNLDNIILKTHNSCEPLSPMPVFDPIMMEIAEYTFPDSIINPCVEDYIQAAYYNSHLQYEEQLTQYQDDFVKNYRTTCIHDLVETFTKSYSDNEYQFTLYYYDRAGNLVQTIPPAGVDVFTGAELDDINQKRFNHELKQNDHSYTTTYKYNSLNKVIWQKSPDEQESGTYFWYDWVGRIVASMSPKQLEQGLNTDNNPEGEPYDNYYYSYTRYDHLGRIIETGEVMTPTGIKLKEYFPNGFLPNTSDSDPNYIYGDFPQRLTNASKRQVTCTYYDEPYLDAQTQQDLFGTDGQTNLRNRISAVVYHEVYSNNTEQFCPYPGQNPPAYYPYVYASHYSYDEHGNVKTLVQDNPSLADVPLHGTIYGNRYKIMNYEYDLISGKVTKVSYQPGFFDEFYHRYEYDADNRLTNVYTSSDNVIWDQDAKYWYYKHGPLARTEIGDDKLQGLDYYYTLQGWLKGINVPYYSAATDPGADGNNGQQQNLNHFVGRDELSQLLAYNSNDFETINSSVSLGAGSSSNMATMNLNNLYNGNISAMVRDIRNFGQSDPAASVFATSYKYDQLNRITESNTQEFSSTSGYSHNNGMYYDTRYLYDANGNIKGLKRKGKDPDNLNHNMDYLTYNYEPGTNKLTSVDDAITGDPFTDDIEDQGAGNYDYDASGNLVHDESANIKEIIWGNNGKVREVNKYDADDLAGGHPLISDPNIEYRYDGTGNRIGKIVKTRRTGQNGEPTGLEYLPFEDHQWLYTWYVRDAQGNIMAVYDHRIDNYEEVIPGEKTIVHYLHEFKIGEHIIYGSNRLGRKKENITLCENGLKVFLARNPYKKKLGSKEYELTNHLGNVNVVITDKRKAIDAASDNITDYYMADVKSANDYFPFGMKISQRSVNLMTAEDNNTGYRFGFGGQEQDFSVNLSDGSHYNAEGWEYDSRFGRRWNIDARFKDFPSQSPYSCFNGNPIVFNDPSGEGGEITNITTDENGKSTGTLKYTLVLYPNDNAVTPKDLEAMGTSMKSVFEARFPIDGSKSVNLRVGDKKTEVAITNVDFQVVILNSVEEANNYTKTTRPSDNFYFVAPDEIDGFGGAQGGYIGMGASDDTKYEEMLHNLGVEHNFNNFNSPMFKGDNLDNRESVMKSWKEKSPKNEFTLNWGEYNYKGTNIGHYVGMKSPKEYIKLTNSPIFDSKKDFNDIVKKYQVSDAPTEKQEVKNLPNE